jgi:hypothetical protein
MDIHSMAFGIRFDAVVLCLRWRRFDDTTQRVLIFSRGRLFVDIFARRASEHGSDAPIDAHNERR